MPDILMSDTPKAPKRRLIVDLPDDENDDEPDAGRRLVNGRAEEAPAGFLSPKERGPRLVWALPDVLLYIVI
jgi:hypothetical protein